MFLNDNDTNSERKDGIQDIWYHSVERTFKIAILSKQLVINITLPKIEWVFEYRFHRHEKRLKIFSRRE